MSRQDVRELIAGRAGGWATGLGWVPAQVVRSLTWGSGIENVAEGLEAVASALRLDLVFVPAEEDWAPEAVSRLHDAEVASVWTVTGVLGRVARDRGWLDVIKRSAADPGSIATALDEALHEAMNDLRVGEALGVDVALIADELAGPSGWLVAPDFALDALMPCYQHLVAAHTSGPTIFHSDGDMRVLMDALRRAGFSGLHFGSLTADQLAGCIPAARAAGLVPLGGVDVQSLASQGARRTGESAAHLARSGPMVLVDDGGITTAEEVAWFEGALDAARASLGLTDA